jgi:hypothetical protein
MIRWISMISAALIALTALAPSAVAGPSDVRRTVTIRGDHGGAIAVYAMKVARIKREGRHVRFAGRCDSACTLHLALSSSRACVSSGATFGFHLPFGVSPRATRVATNYMLSQYPGWVRGWISANGGLTHRVITMRYDYARRYLPDCDPEPQVFAGN